jgi:hypothetical protein
MPDRSTSLHARTRSFASVATSALLSLSLISVVSAQGVEPVAVPPAALPQETPWPIVLGMRTAALERSWPIVDQVVLVPDGRTYLDELSRWSETARWPVLFEDDVYAPLFVRGFKPSRVIRRASVGAMPADRGERERLIATSAAEALKDGAVDVIAACSAREFFSSMVILASGDDPAWTAAAALAAGRGAPIHWTSDDFGRVNDKINATTFARLANELERAADRTGLPWKGLGDAIDAFAICREIGWKCDPNLPEGLRVNIPSGPFPTAPGQPVATLNTLGRHADGIWWAVGSGIVGSEARSAYVAMASLFAPRESAWMFHTYDAGPGWNDYDTAAAVAPLEAQGLVVQSWGRDQSTLDGWRRILMGGFGSDVLFVNSHGVASQFGLAAGGTATARDVPVFDRPAMVHFLHSFSLEFPANEDCVGGAFLDAGAYAYFGSVYEPLLMAFVPPSLVAQRAEALIPFAMAARQFEGALARPWRTMSYGDPLALLASKARIGAKRVPPPEDTAASLRDEAVYTLKGWKESKDPKALAEAMRALELAGEDERVRQAWKIAVSTDGAREAAPYALGALFRARDLDGYAVAYAMTAKPSRVARQMLWQLAVPRLGLVTDPRVVALLARDPRGPDPSVDLMTLRPTGLRLLGSDGWRAAVDRLARETTNGDLRRQIESAR